MEADQLPADMPPVPGSGRTGDRGNDPMPHLQRGRADGVNPWPARASPKDAKRG